MAVSRDHTLFAANTKSGVSLAANAQLLAESAVAAEHFVQQSLGVLVNRNSLSVGLAASDAEDGGVPVVASLLREAAGAASADPSDIAICVSAGLMPAADLWHARVAHLGSGPLFVCGAPPRGAADWQSLWDLRAETDLRLATATEVTSACRLLAAEPAAVVLPGTAVQAPVASAWVGRRLWLPDFVTGAGQVDEPRLVRAAARAVDSGEKAHAEASWPTPRMRYDASLNRRLAVELAGIGTLVAALGLDPADFGTLLVMSRLVASVREALVRQSRRLADTLGPAPVLEQAGRSPRMADRRLREGWLQQWRQALASSAQRHRNLVVMSPWSLFPAGEAAPYSYTNLAPLLRYADACAFPAPPDLSAWSLAGFVNFHRQVAAVLQQRSGQRQIAEPA